MSVFTKIFGPKRDEVSREWRKLYNEKLNDLYFFFSSWRYNPHWGLYFTAL